VNPYYQSGGITLHHGDCLDVMAELEPNSVEAVVTDPPYGLSKEPDIRAVLKHWLDGDDYEHGSSGFMGKTWDSFVPGPVIWKECHRVLKPGGYLLCFASTRTFDLMAIALRLAGFDQHPFLAWIFGSGFPKAANLSKAIDKAAGVEREVVGPNLNARHGRVGCSTYQRGNDACENPDITAPSTDAAKQWDGWYYGKQSLKPAMEPILMFQKPPEGRMVDNVQKWGCGGLNIDGCRVGTEDVSSAAVRKPGTQRFDGQNHRPHHDGEATETIHGSTCGRFPANLILSYPEDEYDADGNLLPNPGKDEVLAGFPQTSSWAIKREVEGYGSDSMFLNGRSGPSNQHGDSGSAARFFKTCPPDNHCSLCCLPWQCDGDKIEAWKPNNAKRAATHSTASHLPKLDSVPQSAALPDASQLARSVKSAANLCDSCAINIAAALAVVQTAPSGELRRILGSIEDWKKSILLPSLATFAEMMGSTGTTPTIQSLSLLFGSVHHAIDEHTRRERQAAAAGGNGQGSATRFHYTSKASRSDRDGSTHPTVKPTDLMRYLVRLVCPIGGTVLDPFNGSGATTYAAREEHCKAIGIDLSAEYCADAAKRLRQGVLDFS
jgi:DNA modification methylase